MESSSIIYINSLNRLSGTSNSFTYAIQLSDVDQYDRVTLLQCNIPMSYYMVQAGYNTFRLQEGATIVTISIPIGNYSAISFKAVVLPLINAASPNHWVYTMTIPTSFSNANTGKYTFTVTGNASQPSFIFTTNVYEFFGFTANSTNTFSGNTLTSTNVVKFIPEDCIMIHSDICDNNENSVLQEVFLNNSSNFSNITYQCPDIVNYSRKLRTNNSNAYTFYITNENNRLLDLNGLDLIFTIIVFKKEKSIDLIKDFLKYYLLKQN